MRRTKASIYLLAAMWFAPHCQMASAQGAEEIRELIFEYGNIGYKNIKFNINLDTAEYYLTRALEFQYAEPNYIIDDRVAGNHINLASVYRTIYNNSKALEHLNKAEEILKEVDPESRLFGGIYNNKGNIIKGTYDLYTTRQYYEYALDWLVRTGYRNTGDFLEIYSNYINILFELGDKELAIQKLSEIDIDLLSLTPELGFDFHQMKATGFAMFDRNKEALKHYRIAKQLLDNNDLAHNIYKRYNYYWEIIQFYINIEDYENAYREITSALLFVESLGRYSKKLKTTYYSTFQYFYASVLFMENKLERSRYTIDATIENLVEFLGEQSSATEDSNIRNEKSSYLPELNILKSRVLLETYQRDKTGESLMEAFNAYKFSIDLLNSLKLSIENEESKIFATSEVLEVYNEAIYVAKLLYEETDELAYLEEAFEFTESSKSFALFSEIKDVEAMEFSDLPPEVKKKEQLLIGEIQGYEEMLYDEQLSADPDSKQLAYYKEKLFHLQDDYNDLMHEIERDYNKYFKFKYNPKFISLQEVQHKLAHREALIEYVLTDTMLITYVVDRDGINVITRNIDPRFSDECIAYYRLLETQNFSNGVYDNYKKYVKLGRKFYKTLIEPALACTDRKNFTIVPDGAITYLPFEGFLTREADTTYINYLTLPYMIREYSVGYSHSATLMFSERMKSKTPTKEVLAFAPLYFNPLSYTDTTRSRQVVSEDGYLLPLAGIIKEVQSINETVPAKIFLNEKATEANFKKYASDYNVLHLAMHTIMRDDNPLYSLLAFTNVGDAESGGEDNKLYAYEIYNLTLNAQMAVLSSCSSGFGKMQKGEGMMSLARGFMYAGCPSIVMTLWQVADKSSSQLMTSFYKYLKKGKSKQEAMRLSKIDYLETADDISSNPYFWSGFVVLGDNSPIYRKSGIVYWISIIALFFAMLIYFHFKKS